MSKVQAMLRKATEIVDIVDDPDWDWNTVLAKLRKRTLLNFLPIALRPWKLVIAPKDIDCQMTTMRGEPLWRFKEYKGFAYCLQQEPSPGFPGS